MSFVDVSPSTVMRFRLSPTASRNARASKLGSTAASVVKNASIVAMLGAIIPAPLAMAPIVSVSPPSEKRTRASLGRVSVVRMARAASAPASRPRRVAARAMPARTLSMGRRVPMTPVEATTTSVGAQPIAFAVTAAISRASAIPGAPVAALAQPALITTARARPAARCSRDTITGAAWARLVVKTAAAEQS